MCVCPQDNSQIDKKGYFSYANDSSQLSDLEGAREELGLKRSAFIYNYRVLHVAGLSLPHLSTSFPPIPLFLSNRDATVIPSLGRACVGSQQFLISLRDFLIPAEHFRIAVNVLTYE